MSLCFQMADLSKTFLTLRFDKNWTKYWARNDILCHMALFENNEKNYQQKFPKGITGKSMIFFNKQLLHPNFDKGLPVFLFLDRR